MAYYEVSFGWCFQQRQKPWTHCMNWEEDYFEENRNDQ
jgi:hypothetical protein